MPERFEDLQPFMRPRIPGQPPQNPMAAEILRGLATLPGRMRASAESAFMGGDYNPEPVVQGAMMAMGMPARGTASLGTLYLRPNRSGGGGYRMMNETGKDMGPITVNQVNPKQVSVDWIGNYDYEKGANAIGFKDIRSLLRAISAEFPGAETVIGDRVSGARFHTGSGPSVASTKLPSLTSEQLYQYQTEKAIANSLYNRSKAPPADTRRSIDEISAGLDRLLSQEGR